MKNGPGDSRIEATAAESFGELWVIAMFWPTLASAHQLKAVSFIDEIRLQKYVQIRKVFFFIGYHKLVHFVLQVQSKREKH